MTQEAKVNLPSTYNWLYCSSSAIYRPAQLLRCFCRWPWQATGEPKSSCVI